MSKIEVGHDVIDSMVWMSYRYCIGRKTIAAYHHASELASFLNANRELLGEERLKFYAKDIIDCINSQLRFCDNVEVGDMGVDLLENLMPHYNDVGTRDESVNTDHIVYRVYNDGISTRVASSPVHCSFRDVVGDLMPWYKLAKALLAENLIIVNFEGKLMESPGFSWISQDGKRRYTTTENYFSNPFAESWISSEFIKEVRDVH